MSNTYYTSLCCTLLRDEAGPASPTSTTDSEVKVRVGKGAHLISLNTAFAQFQMRHRSKLVHHIQLCLGQEAHLCKAFGCFISNITTLKQRSLPRMTGRQCKYHLVCICQHSKAALTYLTVSWQPKGVTLSLAGSFLTRTMACPKPFYPCTIDILDCKVYNRYSSSCYQIQSIFFTVSM